VSAGASSQRSFVVRAFTEHLPLKGLALLASIALFVTVHGTENAEISMAVGVAVVQPPTNERMLVSEIPDQVRVTLRGSRSVLTSLRRTGLPSIQMDLQQDTGHFYYFDAEELELPAGASIVQIAPSAVPLRWVQRAERRLRIEPVMEGELSPGHVLARISVDPEMTGVSGAASEVGRMGQVRTAAIDVSGLAAGRHQRRVPLGVLPEHVQYSDASPVMVTIVVEEEIGTRAFGELEVAVVGATDVAVRPAQVTVNVRGPRARIDTLPPRRIVPVVDVTEIDPARGAQPVPVLLRGVPEGLTATVEPTEVLVVVPVR
jgi:YbbR domain-containing protein